MIQKRFHVLVELDKDGIYVGKVCELVGCAVQGHSLNELMKNVRLAVEVCLDVENVVENKQNQFVGLLEVEV